MGPASPLFISEDCVRSLLQMPDAIDALQDAFGAKAGSIESTAINMTRQRSDLTDGFFNVMAATLPGSRTFGLKAYYRSSGKGGYHVLLYSESEGRLLAVIEADYLSQLRTGAASGIAAKYMARTDSLEMALIGTGKQSFWQVAAVAVVRPLARVRVFGRTSAKAVALARRIEAELGIEAAPMNDARRCVEEAGIVATITTSETPVCEAEWVAAGTHINAAGANTAKRQELGTELAMRAAVLATDDVHQARLEAAEYRELDRLGVLDWSSVVTLEQLCNGTPGRRSPEDITIFKSLGIAIEDVALATRLYERLQEAGTRAAPPRDT